LWNQGDIKTHALMTEKVHEYGALAGVELWAAGAGGANLLTREVALGVGSMPNLEGNPLQTRAMDRKDIRECIGCNICYSGDSLGVPIRCTQNPTMGEEWRRGWHPERIQPKSHDATVLVVGAGPAGLEATRALGQRGYMLMLAEASTELGAVSPRNVDYPAWLNGGA
jgi:hypothetical protein